MSLDLVKSMKNKRPYVDDTKSYIVINQLGTSEEVDELWKV